MAGPTMQSPIISINAISFEDLVGSLAETMAQKLKREGLQTLSAPFYMYADLFILIRQARNTYDFLFYVNADERRSSDVDWRSEYTFICAPLVRSMIDGLYNITMLLEDPWVYGPRFRKSGYRKIFLGLDIDEKRFGSKSNWQKFITEKRELVRLELRQCELNEADVRNKKINPDWLTLGRYLARDGTSSYTPHQEFLSSFTFGPWREYSAISHGSFEGLVQVGAFFNRDGHRHEDRPKLDEAFPGLMSLHIGRSALILLCIVTEVQLKFNFKGANIGTRIKKAWELLKPLAEGELVYRDRYEDKLKGNQFKTQT
jgi:hypothetical protein